MELLEHGGWILGVIFALSFSAWFLIVYKWFYVRNDTKTGFAWMDAVIPAIQKENFRNARTICSHHPGLGERMIAGLLDVHEAGGALSKRHRRKIAERETGRMRRHLDLITVSSAVLPLLGLLGTVIGMAGTFEGLTLRDLNEAHTIMAGGISKALITTQAGLAAALPILLMYGVLASLIRRKIDEGLRAMKRIEAILSQGEKRV